MEFQYKLFFSIRICMSEQFFASLLANHSVPTLIYGVLELHSFISQLARCRSGHMAVGKIKKPCRQKQM